MISGVSSNSYSSYTSASASTAASKKFQEQLLAKLDADGDGKTEVLVMSPGVLPAPLFAEGPAGRWSQVAHLSYGCKSMYEQIKEGRFTLAPPRFKDLEVAGSRLQLEPDLAAADCK